ncbi:DUF3127 domain-containing protein [Candidatus Karelsulcia muelleri]
MEIIGTVKEIFDMQVFKNNFKKREILLKTEEQYPQILRIEFILDKTKLLNSLKKDDKIKIFINLKGNKWTTKKGKTIFFNSIQGWKIENIIENIIENMNDEEDDDEEDDDEEDDDEEDDSSSSSSDTENNDLTNEFDSLPF